MKMIKVMKMKMGKIDTNDDSNTMKNEMRNRLNDKTENKMKKITTIK